MTGILQAAAVAAAGVTSPDGLSGDGAIDPGLDTSPSDGFGGVGALMLLIVLGSVVVLVVKVVLARRIARGSGMDQGHATAMTLLSDDGLDATYLAANVRPRSSPGQRSTDPPARARSTEDRLAELQSLLDRGLVTREEYAARRRAILDSL